MTHTRNATWSIIYEANSSKPKWPTDFYPVAKVRTTNVAVAEHILTSPPFKNEHIVDTANYVSLEMGYHRSPHWFERGTTVIELPDRRAYQYHRRRWIRVREPYWFVPRFVWEMKNSLRLAIWKYKHRHALQDTYEATPNIDGDIEPPF